MALPNAQEYQEALQYPKSVFDDADLKHSVPYLSRLHLPISSAGGYAIVFKLKGGGRDYAVRCFTRQAGDQQQRYNAIRDHIHKAALPYTVGFDYIQNGIRVNNKWHPVLKMEWAEGQRLDAYIHSILTQPGQIIALSAAWLQMLKDLAAAGIAHGDLQHGNVLVHNGKLRLVDYDGMFVPSLRGRASNEMGHRNYQHPRQTERDFDQHLDRFSSWIIYLSLLALSVEPTLWMRRLDDESLVLSHRDYLSPTQSGALNHLRQHPDARIKDLASKIVQMLSMPLEQLPELSGAGLQVQNKPGQLPAWLQQYKQAAPKVNNCPKCNASLVKKPNRILKIDYWQCSAAPRCPYTRDDLDGLQQSAPPPQVGPVASVVSAPPPIVAPSISNLPTAKTTKRRTSSKSTPPAVRGRKKQVVATRSIDECDFCGTKLNVVAGNPSYYVCPNYPACNFSKPI
jgi:ssDNA-binding Zn-finger/Zn-ribbon topoisomerase 1